MVSARPLPPKPLPDVDTQPFWDAVAERRLIVQRCGGCDHWIWQPRPICPRCHEPEPAWREVSGEARVVSWTVVHPPVLPVWEQKVPFVILLVELADAPGVRMLGQLCDDDGALLKTDGEAQGVRTGVRCTVRWREDEGGQILPVWTIGE